MRSFFVQIQLAPGERHGRQWAVGRSGLWARFWAKSVVTIGTIPLFVAELFLPRGINFKWFYSNVGVKWRSCLRVNINF